MNMWNCQTGGFQRVIDPPVQLAEGSSRLSRVIFSSPCDSHLSNVSCVFLLFINGWRRTDKECLSSPCAKIDNWGARSLPKMGTGKFLIFIFDKQLLKELVQKPRLLSLTFSHLKSELHGSTLRLAVHCLGDKSRLVRKHLSLLGGFERHTWTPVNEVPAWQMSPQMLRLKCFHPPPHLIYILSPQAKWDEKAEVNSTRKMRRRELMLRNGPVLGLVRLEYKLISAFRAKPVWESVGNYGIF